MPPKAKGESKRGVVVTLVFFVLATIGLGISTYYGMAEQDKKDALVKKSAEEKAFATDERDWYRFQVGLMMAYLDKAPDANTPIGRELVNRAGFDAGTYPQPKVQALDSVKVEIPALKALVLKLNTRSPWDGAKGGPQSNYEALIKVRDTEIGDLKTKFQKSEEERLAAQKVRTDAETARDGDRKAFAMALEKLKEDFKGDRDGYVKKINDLQDLLKKVEDKKDVEFIKPIVAERDAIKADRDSLSKQLKEANDKLLAVTAKLAVRGGSAGPGDDKQAVPTPRGKIVRVQLNPRKAIIDLGRRDGLTPQTTFAIHGYQPNGKPKLRSKGNIEVITVGESTSEVLVTAIFHPNPETDDIQGVRKVIDVLSKDNVDPIIPGDALINPVWNPNVKTHIVIAGLIDAQGGIVIHLNTLVAALERMNVIVDAYIDPLDGSIKGRGLTRRTDYVLQGIKPTGREPGGPKDEATLKKISEEIDKLVNEARSSGVRVMTPRRFLQETGFNLPRNVE